MTDRYVVIGHPIAHSKSPAIHQAFAAQTGQDLRYDTLLSPLDDFAGTWQAFRAVGGRGANVTVPFKEEAWALCHQLSHRARLAGAVNTLSVTATGELLGDNTDGLGLVQDICVNAGWPLANKRVLLLGAGGAARGVIQPLLAAGVSMLWVANRSVEKAQTLAALFAQEGAVQALALTDLSQVHEPVDVIINATSASLHGERLALPGSLVHADTVAYDMMYGRDTAFLQWAREHGVQHRRDGLGMLVEQLPD